MTACFYHYTVKSKLIGKSAFLSLNQAVRHCKFDYFFFIRLSCRFQRHDKSVPFYRIFRIITLNEVRQKILCLTLRASGRTSGRILSVPPFSEPALPFSPSGWAHKVLLHSHRRRYSEVSGIRHWNGQRDFRNGT